MLSYQHGYHAGNFADVIKHLTLTRVLNYLTLKEKPLFYLETHAGRGLYDLEDRQALKTQEATQGIFRLWEEKHQLPHVFSPYLELISTFNQKDKLRYYPGSPAFAIHMLREYDRLFLCELHPEEFKYLKTMKHHNMRVHYSHSDGLKELKALLPPTERRGLIFIDPSYEIKTDYRQIPQLLKTVYRRFSTGVYCIWYPLVDRKFNEQLQRGFNNIGTTHHLRVEFYLHRPSEAGMTGCGLLIINPPYVLLEELKLALEVLCRLFNPGLSSYLLEN